MRTRPHHDERSMSCHSRTEADTLCTALNALLETDQPHPCHMDTRRVITGYEVRGHSFHARHRMGDDSTVLGWGIWPKWRYADRKDLTFDFGGPFIAVADAREYLDRSLHRRMTGETG